VTDQPDAPASTAPLASGLPLVKGHCPACHSASLFLGDGGYITCSRLDCPEPDAATTLLERSLDNVRTAPDSAEPRSDVELTADEARELATDLGRELYEAQDAIAFVGECCDIADREQHPVTTALVRQWLKGASCGRQLAADATPDNARTAPDSLTACPDTLASRLRERYAKALRPLTLDDLFAVPIQRAGQPARILGWQTLGFVLDKLAAVRDAELQQLLAEREQFRAIVERGFTQHMQFSLIKPDGTTEQLPCADWCYACRLKRAQGAVARVQALAEQPDLISPTELRTVLEDTEALACDGCGDELTHGELTHWCVPCGAVAAVAVEITADVDAATPEPVVGKLPDDWGPELRARAVHGHWALQRGSLHPQTRQFLDELSTAYAHTAGTTGHSGKCWFEKLLDDLDRCGHGRHPLDMCLDCGGASVGNPHLTVGQIIGYTRTGAPYYVPAYADRHKPEAWRTAPAGTRTDESAGSPKETGR